MNITERDHRSTASERRARQSRRERLHQQQRRNGVDSDFALRRCGVDRSEGRSRVARCAENHGVNGPDSVSAPKPLHSCKIRKIKFLYANIDRLPRFRSRLASIRGGLLVLCRARVVREQQIPTLTRKFKRNGSAHAARCSDDNGKTRHDRDCTNGSEGRPRRTIRAP